MPTREMRYQTAINILASAENQNKSNEGWDGALRQGADDCDSLITSPLVGISVATQVSSAENISC
jgi:hypothetical protein